jgi:hypothetical protein
MRSKTKLAKATGRSPSDTFVNDIVYLVLEEVGYDRKYDLLSLCLVSQRFYILGIPHLYREIDLDLTKQSHTSLVRRLVNHRSRLAEKIRYMSIAGTRDTAKPQLVDLCVLLPKITHLEQLEWKVHLKVPYCILQTLAAHLPKTNLVINTTVEICNAHYDPVQGIITRLDLSAGAQLTQFCFRSTHYSALDPRLKAGLVEMLTCSPVLQTLIWHECHTSYTPYPEMLHAFTYGNLPPLKSFLLCSMTLFTDQELRLWASRGGWRELTNVKFVYAHQICALIGFAPKLQEISFFAVEALPLNRITARLQNTSFDRPFGHVLYLRYQDTAYPYTYGGRRQTVPWCMLKVIPGLKELALQHGVAKPADGLLWPTPTVEDVRKIRKLQPHLTKLCIDISLPGIVAKWPRDVLSELALFEEPIHLVLFLHAHDIAICRTFLHGPAFRNMYGEMVEIRKLKRLPCQLPFKVSFKVVRSWPRVKDHYLTPDVSIWSGLDGRIRSQKRDALFLARKPVERMTEEELVAARAAQHLSRRVGWDRKGYEKELLLRERNAGPNGFLDLDLTLWDAWTC